MHTEVIDAFQLQKYLLERATQLRYAYFASLIYYCICCVNILIQNSFLEIRKLQKCRKYDRSLELWNNRRKKNQLLVVFNNIWERLTNRTDNGCIRKNNLQTESQDCDVAHDS